MSPLKLLDRLKKLLALSSSSNANEAANAAAAAQRIMLEHKIEQADLDVGGEADVVEPVAEFTVEETKKGVTWKAYLLTGVARSNHCEAYRSLIWKQSKVTGKRHSHKSSLQVVGTNTDVQAVTYIYKYLCNEIERLTHDHAHGRGRGYANSFKLGAVQTINMILRKQKQDLRASSETALTVIDKSAAQVADFLKDQDLKAARPADTGNAFAFAKGQIVGATVSLPGKEQRQLGAEPARLKSS